ncbi:hypothetical protein [Catellatospora coxensis]|uniref:Secreted protein n=1 Tax=Catellatospora coxensis TaxID=310354 RepID=A0A8J3KQX0_9ACTN|nr:hypothetical protein [Catellatospora coxensis]GIG07452.1 hypothetical protein Cco03nite_41520 [Catellatospora coxensis]
MVKAAPTMRVIVAAVVLGAVLAPAAPAAALPDPLITLQEQASESSPDPKTVVVSCPDDAWVFAVGGWTDDSSGQALLTRLEPAADLRSGIVSARPANGGTTPFSLTAQVICARTLVAPTRVANTTMQGISIEVECPAPTVMLGFGFAMGRNAENRRLDQLEPDGDLTQVTVGTSGVGQTGSLTAYGICHTVVETPGALINIYRATGIPVTGQTWPKLATLLPMTFGLAFGVGAIVTGPGSHLDGFLLRPFGEGVARADRISTLPGLPILRTPARTTSLMGPAEDPSLTTVGARIGTFH